MSSAPSLPDTVEQWFRASSFTDGSDAARRRARRALQALEAGAFSELDPDIRAALRQRLQALTLPPVDALPGTT